MQIKVLKQRNGCKDICISFEGKIIGPHFLHRRLHFGVLDSHRTEIERQVSLDASILVVSPIQIKC